MENEEADVGRDGRTRLARPYCWARMGTDSENRFSCSADPEQDWQPYPVDPYSAIYDDSYILFRRYLQEYSSTVIIPCELNQ